jgi:regulatory protein
MLNETDMLRQLAAYCSQAERCICDVRKKIQAENFPKEIEQNLIDKLIHEKFIDERRFARSFVHDKFHFNHWGVVKIGYELKMKGIPSDVCREAIDTTIDEDEYLTVLTDLLTAKKRSVKGRSQQDVYQKLFRFATSKGFESTHIIHILKKMFKNIDDD